MGNLRDKMKRQIDIARLLERTQDLPPSPRDPRITFFGIASIAFYAVAAYCAWKIGGWWGIGLVGCFLIINTLDEFVHEEHREELVDLHGLLARRIAENSRVLDDVIPMKESAHSGENSP
jgi:hypothetical protein